MKGKAIELLDSHREGLSRSCCSACARATASSFDVLDRVFLAEPVDTLLSDPAAKHGTIVTLACTEPEETCFCHAFGIDAGRARRRRDVAGWTTKYLYWRANTEKGKRPDRKA